MICYKIWKKNPSDKQLLNELYATKLRLQRLNVQFSGAKPVGISKANKSQSIFLNLENEKIPRRQ